MCRVNLWISILGSLSDGEDMFDGHKFYILDQGWVFDLTDGLGYQVTFDSQGNVSSYKK